MSKVKKLSGTGKCLPYQTSQYYTSQSCPKSNLIKDKYQSLGLTLLNARSSLSYNCKYRLTSNKQQMKKSFQGQGLQFSSKDALNYTGEVVPWMKNVCEEKYQYQISNVSDLNRCYEKLTYEKNDIVKSMEFYFRDNATFVPLSLRWKQFLHPCNFLSSFNLRFQIISFSVWKVLLCTEHSKST